MAKPCGCRNVAQQSPHSHAKPKGIAKAVIESQSPCSKLPRGNHPNPYTSLSGARTCLTPQRARTVAQVTRKEMKDVIGAIAANTLAWRG
jgi:hypothetical protein